MVNNCYLEGDVQGDCSDLEKIAFSKGPKFQISQFDFHLFQKFNRGSNNAILDAIEEQRH